MSGTGTGKTPKILLLVDPTTSDLATATRAGGPPTIQLCVICHVHKNTSKLTGPLVNVLRDKFLPNYRKLDESGSKVICRGCRLQLKSIYEDGKAIKALEAKIGRTVAYLKGLREGGFDQREVVQDNWASFVPNEDTVDAVPIKMEVDESYEAACDYTPPQTVPNEEQVQLLTESVFIKSEPLELNSSAETGIGSDASFSDNSEASFSAGQNQINVGSGAIDTVGVSTGIDIGPVFVGNPIKLDATIKMEFEQEDVEPMQTSQNKLPAPILHTFQPKTTLAQIEVPKPKTDPKYRPRKRYSNTRPQEISCPALKSRAIELGKSIVREKTAYSSPEELANVRKSREVPNNLSCPSCAMFFDCQNSLDRHFKYSPKHATEEQQTSCDRCSEKFPSLLKRIDHDQAKHPEMFSKPTLNKIPRYLKSLPTKACEGCGQEFYSEDGFRRHVGGGVDGGCCGMGRRGAKY